MRFKKFLPIASAFTTTVLAQGNSCPEAARFGLLKVSPTALSPGKTFTLTANLTCVIQLGNTPTFLDYYIDVVATHTVSGPILIARRTYDNSTIDQFTAVLPNWFYFADAQYPLMVDNSFVRSGPTGESLITVGGISTGINITNF
ncbi:hypothetical protein B0H13DRAFT_2539186 [Mycena leptocephala]|nr:hypothetical protein B0H13DRAFT_2539186 [Mycena leptocephala]